MYFLYFRVEIPLTNRIQGPYRKLRTEFFPLGFMAQAWSEALAGYMMLGSGVRVSCQMVCYWCHVRQRCDPDVLCAILTGADTVPKYWPHTKWLKRKSLFSCEIVCSALKKTWPANLSFRRYVCTAWTDILEHIYLWFAFQLTGLKRKQALILRIIDFFTM